MSRPGDFSRATVFDIAARTGFHCAYPCCGRSTIVLSRDGLGAVLIGQAAHIVAASENGPRRWADNPDITIEQIRCADNGIWLCPNHAVLIDRDIAFHSVERLQHWQKAAEENNAQSQNYGRQHAVSVPPHVVTPRARAFYSAVQAVLPRSHISTRPTTTRFSDVQAMRKLIGELWTFHPDHPMHGEHPELVLLQRKMIEDLSVLASLLDDQNRFWRNEFDYLAANDQATADEADRRLGVLWEDLRLISDRWIQGQAYYGPPSPGGL